MKHHRVFDRIVAHLKTYDIWYISGLALVARCIGMFWMSYTNFPEFYRDYAMVSRAAHGAPVWLGPPSMLGGFHFAPFYYYAMVPLYWVFNMHPLGLNATGIVISVLAIYMQYKLVMLWTSSAAFARLAAVYAALAVYGLHLTSYTSNPNFLPLFVLWYWYHLTLILQGSVQKKDYIWAGVAFALATQLHTTALIVLPLVTILAFILLRRNVAWRRWLYAVAVCVLLYLPYLMYDAVHGFANVRRLFMLGAQNLQGGHVGAGVHALWNFFQGTLTPFNFWYNYTNIEPNSLYAVVAALYALVLIAIVWQLYRNNFQLNKSTVLVSREGVVLAGLWLLVEAAVILLYSRAAHDHYVIILWPLPMIVLAYATLWLKQKTGVCRIVIVCIVAVQLLQIISFYRRAYQDWSVFFPTYNQFYKDNPNVSEIGASWK